VKKLATTVMLVAFLAPLFVCGQENVAPSVSMHMAALQGNVEAIRGYIKAGADLNEKDAYGSTPLIIAITFGKPEVAKALIEAGADLGVTDNNGSTPLHLAAFFSRPDIVRALLENGANRYARNNSGSTAFDIAQSPFDYDIGIYDELGAALAPLGLKLDYERIKRTRPEIAEMLRPSAEDLKAVDYMPLQRDDWKVSTPVAQGVDPLFVAELYLDANELETLYGLLVIKNDYLIAEKYFNKGSVEQLSKRASVTKSYTSALVGIALDKGCLSSVDQKMIDFFPDVADQVTDPRKKQITIREMLQMRAGYPWEETDPVLWDALWSGSYLHCIADIPLISDPGTEFNYSNLTSDWLGIIVARACDTDLKTFGEQYLFSPLGVKIGDWNRDLEGYYIGSGDIQFTARDMAKFGLLYLNGGEYKGEQLIPVEWVEQSLESYSKDAWVAIPPQNHAGRYLRDLGYGYQWWSGSVGEHHIDFAWGHGGQLIVLLADHDMVIVSTADPFYGKDLHWRAWKHEQSIINVVGKFIKSLPAN
jgi:CubicO group peptidase (beta-lactamase class C family)